MNNYWDDIYWKKHLKEDDLTNIEDNWVEEYLKYIPKEGKLLDLGCGIGQYSLYFDKLGYEVSACDISTKALEQLNKMNSTIKTQVQDMNDKLKYDDSSFDIVFANLSMHFLDEEHTKILMNEINRILKHNGIFIGSVNSIKAYEYIKDHVIELEKNYYDSNGRNVRLFDKQSFEEYFRNFEEIKLIERETDRFGHKKNKWEFIYRKN